MTIDYQHRNRCIICKKSFNSKYVQIKCDECDKKNEIKKKKRIKEINLKKLKKKKKKSVVKVKMKKIKPKKIKKEKKPKLKKEKAVEVVKTLPVELRKSNPKGYNKYKKDPKPKPKKSGFLQEIDIMTTIQLIEKNKELFREQWIYKRRVLSLGQKLSMVEDKIFGITKIKKEVEKEL